MNDKTICWAEFEDTYGGLETDENGLVISIDSEDYERINRYRSEHRLWTEYDDGHLESRIGMVNRLRYVVSEKRYKPLEGMVIVDPEIPDWTDWDADAFERRVQYEARKLTERQASIAELSSYAGSAISEGYHDLLEIARKNRDMAYTDDLLPYEDGFAAVQVLVERLKAAEAEIERLQSE